jgi:preprotein translocase subunit SecG
MLEKSKYIALGIIFGLALGKIMSSPRTADFGLQRLLEILPFLLLFGMLVLVIYWKNKYDTENKG